MDRRRFLRDSAAVTAVVPLSSWVSPLLAHAQMVETPVALLVVDLDRATRPIDKGIYGQFLEHINHSVEDGLFAEQIQGSGFEGKDFQTYWKSDADRGQVQIAEMPFQNGSKSVRLSVAGGHATIRQGRIYLERAVVYDGFLWIKREHGSPSLTLRMTTSKGQIIATVPLAVQGKDWHRVPFSFTSVVRDTQSSIELIASGHGALLVDFISMMRSDVRNSGMFRPDLLKALSGLGPEFIRWPGGSFASTYRWKEGIGPYPERGYHPNTFWGGYSDYYGFGTDEFLDLCNKLQAEPLITLPAQGTSPEQIEYAMDWVRYLNDPPTTEWGRRRALNGHPEPYNVRRFQIDNEPMNNGFTPSAYSRIVNVYGAKLRSIAPQAKIVACGQKRSSDMDWSKTVVDLAGANFDLLGCHNYEYEPRNYETGVRRIHDYLGQLRDYIRASKYPHLEIGVLEWSLQHTYDWRAGLHAAGSLMMYEELSPELTMACPALLMRNATDDPAWTASIYHDHVSWFPGGSYPIQKLFREHYAERFLASATGTYRTIPDRTSSLDHLSTAIPQGWEPGSVDAVATASADGKRLVIKAVNYQDRRNSLLVRLRGSTVPGVAEATVYTISAGLMDEASMEHPERFISVSRAMNYASTFSLLLEPYTVAVVEIRSA